MNTPISDQPTLPLNKEAELAVRHMRLIAGQVDPRHADALHDLADGLERSLNHTDVVQR